MQGDVDSAILGLKKPLDEIPLGSLCAETWSLGNSNGRRLSAMPVPSYSAFLPQEICHLCHPLYPPVSQVASKSLLLLSICMIFNYHCLWL